MKSLASAVLMLGVSVWPALGSAAPGAPVQEILEKLEASTADAALAADPIAKARDALKRAQAARGAGDTANARILDAIAKQWALVATDVVRAAAAEAAAEKAERRLGELETRRVRARALLEETVARRARASQKLEQLDAPEGSSQATPPPESTSPANPKGASSGAPEKKP